jgi:polyhydroxyalkanoate synthesis regulator protein
MTKVIIVISGGCLLEVFSDEPIEYNLIDYDNIDGGDEVPEEFVREDKSMTPDDMEMFINKVKANSSKNVPEDESEGH